jgi:trk system potassium uptake protein
MLVPLGWSTYYQDQGFWPLIESFLITTGVGGIFYLCFRSSTSATVISHREGMVITSLGWASAGVFGGLPFYFGHVLPQPVDFVFEAVSGFTTTGASVIKDVEVIPEGLLFWRSFTHWLGGLGIVVLGLAILPFLGVGGMQLYKAEVPGPIVDKLKPRLKDTAMILWKVYLFLTVLETILLLIGGMSLLDALCHTFGTLGTGGFSTKNASIGYYNSVYIDVVVTIFMLIGGANFALHFQIVRGHPLVMWRDPEFRFYLGVFLSFWLTISINIYGGVYNSFGQALRYGAFQVATIMTTTGYATADFEVWPGLAQLILVLCMFIGSSVGSTGGGIKCMRIIALLKLAHGELIRLTHPRAVSRVKLGTQALSSDVLSSIWGFCALWLGLLTVSALAVAATGVDAVTAFTGCLACIANVGPAFGAVGPMDNYADLPQVAKWIMTLDMLLGRLEIYTVIILLFPRFYRK